MTGTAVPASQSCLGVWLGLELGIATLGPTRFCVGPSVGYRGAKFPHVVR